MIEKLRIRVSQVFVVFLILMIGVSESAWEERAPLVGIFLFLAGAMLAGVASLGRLWCSLYIAGYKTDRLITKGPYSMCRNPLYFFSLIGGLGVGLASETLFIPALIFVAFALYYPFVIKSEEAELRELHKEQFDMYRESVPSFFPNVFKLKEPEEYVVKPVIFKKHMFDALWFIWLLGILEIIEGLHEMKVLPKIFTFF
ncbi:MAG: isoprenylcysteine carboxylmethyltransferase family protein [Pseudomonadota bacterium]